MQSNDPLMPNIVGQMAKMRQDEAALDVRKELEAIVSDAYLLPEDDWNRAPSTITAYINNVVDTLWRLGIGPDPEVVRVQVTSSDGIASRTVEPVVGSRFGTMRETARFRRPDTEEGEGNA